MTLSLMLLPSHGIQGGNKETQGRKEVVCHFYTPIQSGQQFILPGCYHRDDSDIVLAKERSCSLTVSTDVLTLNNLPNLSFKMSYLDTG